MAIRKNYNLRCSLAVPLSEVLTRIAPHVVEQACEADSAPLPHYQGEMREADFTLIAPPRFGYTALGLRRGPRYTRLPVAIVGTMTTHNGATLVEARVSLVSWSWWFMLGIPLGVLLLMSVLLYPIYSLNHAYVITLASVTTGVTAVLCVLTSWLSLSLDKADFRNVLQGYACCQRTGTPAAQMRPAAQGCRASGAGGRQSAHLAD